MKKTVLLCLLSILQLKALAHVKSLADIITVSTAGSNPKNLIAFKDHLYFTCYNYKKRSDELWRWDGVQAIKDAKFPNGLLSHFMVFNDKLYFVCDYSIKPGKLWEPHLSVYSFDGNSFRREMDIEKSLLLLSNDPANILELFNFKNEIYLLFKGIVLRDFKLRQLYKIKSGTFEEVYEVNLILKDWGSNNRIENLVQYNDKLYFTCDTILWEYDGKKVSPVFKFPGRYSSPGNFIIYHDKLYFSYTSKYDDTNNNNTDLNDYTELRYFDGTNTHSVTIKKQSKGNQGFRNVVLFNDKLYYQRSDGVWAYDEKSFEPVMELKSGRYPYSYTSGQHGIFWMKIFVLNDKLYCPDVDNGYSCWSYDKQGNMVIHPDNLKIFGGYGNNDRHTLYYNFEFIEYKNKLYYVWNDYKYGTEIFCFDGTSSSLMADINNTPILSTLKVFPNHPFFFDQFNYMGKIESGDLIFQKYRHQVDPGPKGYYLDTKQNGIDLNFIHGLMLDYDRDFVPEVFIGIGTGYLNFEGITGFSIFGDFQFSPLEFLGSGGGKYKRIFPFVNFKYGNNYIWNQYERGTKSDLAEIDLGVDWRIKGIRIFVQSGFLMTQQAKFIPIRMGLRL